jgi:lipopolysaccharide export LptBFGC system permease protein LptF
VTLLDRYIARQFLTNTLALFVILCGFVVVIDVAMNLDRFMRLAGRIGGGEGGDPVGGIRQFLIAMVLVADLWWPKLLQLYNFLLGMVMVAAMGFTCAQLTRQREFIAMMAAGIGLQRVMRPILLVAVVLTGVQMLNQELIIPRIAPLLVRGHQDAGNHSLGAGGVSLTEDGQGRLFRAASFDADTGELADLYIMERDQDQRAVRAVRADRGVYRDGGWDLEGGWAEPRGRTPGGDGVAGAAVAGPVARVESSLDPAKLRMQRFESYKQALSYRQVGAMLRRDTLADPAQRATLERIRWGRFAMMLSGLLALVIAMPFYIRREPTNMVIQSLKCAPVAIGALVGGILGASAAIPGIPAALGVFLPVMLLSVVAVAQISGLKT